MNLSKSAENTLLVYANACEYHKKNYHFRSLKQTLNVKENVYMIKRSLSTINRENRKFRDENYILKWKRTTGYKGRGRQFTSSITHLTWKGVYYLIKRKLIPYKFIRVWERISKREKSFDQEIKDMREKREETKETNEMKDRLDRLSKLPLKYLPYLTALFGKE